MCLRRGGYLFVFVYGAGWKGEGRERESERGTLGRMEGLMVTDCDMKRVYH